MARFILVDCQSQFASRSRQIRMCIARRTATVTDSLGRGGGLIEQSVSILMRCEILGGGGRGELGHRLFPKGVGAQEALHQ